MANKNIDPNLVALRTRAAELGVLTSGAFKGITQVKHIDTKALRAWVKNEEARLKEAAAAAKVAPHWETIEAERAQILARAELAERRSDAAKKGVKTRIANAVPVIFTKRRREQVKERIAGAPETALGLALKRAAA